MGRLWVSGGRLGASSRHVWASCGVLGRLGTSWRGLGAVLGHLGGVLRRLGASWGSVFGRLGGVLGRLEPLCTPSARSKRAITALSCSTAFPVSYSSTSFTGMLSLAAKSWRFQPRVCRACAIAARTSAPTRVCLSSSVSSASWRMRCDADAGGRDEGAAAARAPEDGVLEEKTTGVQSWCISGEARFYSGGRNKNVDAWTNRAEWCGARCGTRARLCKRRRRAPRVGSRGRAAARYRWRRRSRTPTAALRHIGRTMPCAPARSPTPCRRATRRARG